MIIRLGEIDSTNLYAKNLLKEEKNAIIIARKQTAGQGTKGRSFSSLEGGVYLTKLDFYKNFPAKNAFQVMANTAVAVCKTLEDFDVFPTIKWANDIFVGEKKICGILIENVLQGKNISASIVGVGLNVSNPLPSELKGIATTLCKESKKPISVADVEERLLLRLSEEYGIEEYRKRVGFLGRSVLLIEGDKTSLVRLCNVNEKGELEVEKNGKTRLIRSGEVSLVVSPPSLKNERE